MGIYNCVRQTMSIEDVVDLMHIKSSRNQLSNFAIFNFRISSLSLLNLSLCSEIITVIGIIRVSIIVIIAMQVNDALLHIILESFPCQYISNKIKQRNTIVAIKQPSRSCIMI